jgi:hypothetical protein
MFLLGAEWLAAPGEHRLRSAKPLGEQVARFCRHDCAPFRFDGKYRSVEKNRRCRQHKNSDFAPHAVRQTESLYIRHISAVQGSW